MAAGHDGEASEALAARLEGTNINRQSFLATDYLNHFNEAVMLLELLPDMPELLDDARQWHPKSYHEHFRDSDFGAKELACLAYDRAPERFRVPFDLTRRALDRRIGDAIETAGRSISRGDREALRRRIDEDCAAIRDLISVASGIIHGCESRARDAADVLLEAEESGDLMAQDAIDALFAQGSASK